MKTTLIYRVSLALLSMLIVSNSFAQKDFGNESVYKFTASQLFNPFPTANKDAVGNISEDENTNAKTLKHFNRKFHAPTDVVWEKTDDTYLATWISGGTTNKSLYGKNGKLIFSIVFSSEKGLPDEIKRLVMNKYQKDTITCVAKINQDNRLIWVVKVASKKQYITARVEDGELEEMETYIKAN